MEINRVNVLLAVVGVPYIRWRREGDERQDVRRRAHAGTKCWPYIVNANCQKVDVLSSSKQVGTRVGRNVEDP